MGFFKVYLIQAVRSFIISRRCKKKKKKKLTLSLTFVVVLFEKLLQSDVDSQDLFLAKSS